MPIAISLFALFLLILAGILLVLLWGPRFGSTPKERAMGMPGDAWLDEGHAAQVAMTRAITIEAAPDKVWPWLEQMGRGAGWYSFDLLDNGGKISARHLVTWIPEPRIGDASPIGYLRHLEPERSLAWWVNGIDFFGATARLVVSMQVAQEGKRSRLVTRMSADTTGRMARPALLAFRFIDSIMACRQLFGIRDRVEGCGVRTTNPAKPETGERDQYQLYETIYASGESAGVKGKELAARWRETAIEDGVLRTDANTTR
jgi:hypothetical protein